jgi:hypothetical protein
LTRFSGNFVKANQSWFIHVGLQTVELQAADPLGAAGTQSFGLLVRQSSPDIVSEAPQPARETLEYRYLARAVDPDADPVSWELLSGPDFLEMDADTGLLHGTPQLIDVGTHTVEIQAMDPTGGAGAQAGLIEGLLPAIGALVEQGELRLVLVAGMRPLVREHFERVINRTGLERHLGQAVRILAADSLDDYLARFEAEVGATDLLLTKPSELTFYAALGLPLILSPGVGVHEERNQQWAAQYGAALELPEIGKLGWWLRARLADGSLARTAWNGYSRLVSTGVYDIVELTCGGWH